MKGRKFHSRNKRKIHEKLLYFICAISVLQAIPFNQHISMKDGERKLWIRIFEWKENEIDFISTRILKVFRSSLLSMRRKPVSIFQVLVEFLYFGYRAYQIKGKQDKTIQKRAAKLEDELKIVIRRSLCWKERCFKRLHFQSSEGITFEIRLLSIWTFQHQE